MADFGGRTVQDTRGLSQEERNAWRGAGVERVARERRGKSDAEEERTQEWPHEVIYSKRMKGISKGLYGYEDVQSA